MTKIYSLLIMLIVLISCKSDPFSEIENQASQQATNYNFGSAATRNFHGLVLSTDGSAVSNATVTIGNKTAQTNAKGVFSINSAEVKENFAYVKVTKAGFVNGARTMVPTTGNNRINIMMIPATTTLSVSSGSVSTVSLPNGTKVKFDGSFKDESGASYNGNVNVALFHLASSNPYLNELLPGSLLANSANGDSRIMETYGMLHVQLTGASGQKLQLANGHTAEMTMAIDASQASTAPSIIPLWSFNETTGIWQEEGSATKVGNFYVGNVSHFSWWNFDIQFPLSNLNIHIENANAQPLSNVVVKLFRQNQNSSHAITDGNGNASGIVPAGEMLIMKIYDACGNVIISNNVGPFVANSTNMLPTITISANNTVTVTGVLKDCSGNNLSSGMVYLNYNPTAAANFFGGLSAFVTNGSFSLNTLSCSSTLQGTFFAVDNVNLQMSQNINFTATTPVTSLGNITVCTAVNEFITYQVDNLAPKNLPPPIGASYSNGTLPNTLSITCFPANSGLGGFQMIVPNVAGVGTYTNLYNITVDGAGAISPAGNNLILQVTNLGAVGQYIDFTINGTYQSNGGAHTLNLTGHVIRDN